MSLVRRKQFIPTREKISLNVSMMMTELRCWSSAKKTHHRSHNANVGCRQTSTLKRREFLVVVVVSMQAATHACTTANLTCAITWRWIHISIIPKLCVLCFASNAYLILETCRKNIDNKDPDGSVPTSQQLQIIRNAREENVWFL